MTTTVSHNNFRICTIVFWIVAVALVVVRLLLSLGNPVWLDPYALADDILMFNYADVFKHFAEWNPLSMAKTMSYPAFLGFVYVSGVPYTLAVGLLWVVAALVSLWFFAHFVKNMYGRLAIFAFFLFCPVAFDIWTGLRIYRQAIIAPSALIAIMLMFLLVVKLYLYCMESRTEPNDGTVTNKFAIRKIVVVGVLAGLSFFFFYYIKEDGAWLMPLVGIAAAAGVYIAIRAAMPAALRAKLAVFALIPIIVFVAGTNVYKAVNHHYFGVFEITTRTGGEFGKFSGKLIDIADENKSLEVWVPYSALEKAWAASETLAGAPELLESMRWQEVYADGDMVANPIPGDLVFWALKASLEDVGLYGSEAQAEAFFRDAGRELDAAFKDGRLEKAGGISISANLPSRTPQEIAGLWPLVEEMFLYQAAWLWSSAKVDFRPHERLATVEEVLHVDIPTKWGDLSYANSLALQASDDIVGVYRGTAPVVLGLAVAGFVCWVIDMVRRRHNLHNLIEGIHRLTPVFAVATALSCLILFAGVAWFSEWLYIGYRSEGLPYVASTILNYYSCGVAPLIMILEVIGISYLLRGITASVKGIRQTLAKG